MNPAHDLSNFFPNFEDIPQSFQPEYRENFTFLVNGQLKYSVSPHHGEVISPILVSQNNYIISRYSAITVDEAFETLNSAKNAYNRGRGFWPTLTIEHRIEYIEKFATKMQEKRQEIIKALVWSIAKSLEDSTKEFDRTLEYINQTIAAAKDLDRNSSRFKIEQDIIAQIRQGSLGVVLCMGPSNYPLNESFCLLIPALLMGNTVVFRPPHLGIPVILPLLEAFRDSFPPGVINIIFGSSHEIVSPLLSSGEIDVFSFIGSSKTAKALKQLHPEPQRLRSITGMDANNGAIIFDDANLDLTIQECLTGTLSYNGQRCTALKVLFVHENIIKPFLDKFSQAVESLGFGLPWQDQVKITPLPELDRISYLNELINDAKEKGAQIINPTGGQTNHTFFFPAIVYPVNPQMRILYEEQFGPIIPVVPFSNEDDPINIVTQSNYGQQISVFTTSSQRIAKLIDPLANQVCRINLNSQCQRGPDIFPFTGRRNSAEGILSVSEALNAFSIPIMVSGKNIKLNQQIFKEIVSNHSSNFLNTDFIF